LLGWIQLLLTGFTYPESIGPFKYPQAQDGKYEHDFNIPAHHGPQSRVPGGLPESGPVGQDHNPAVPGFIEKIHTKNGNFTLTHTPTSSVNPDPNFISNFARNLKKLKISCLRSNKVTDVFTLMDRWIFINVTLPVSLLLHLRVKKYRVLHIVVE